MHQLGSCQFDMSLEPKSNNKKFPSHQNDNKIIETILSSAPALWSKCPLQQIKERLLQGHHKDCNNDNEGPKNACPQGHVAEPSYLGGVVTTSLDKHTHVKHAGGILCWPSIDRLLREFEWLGLISSQRKSTYDRHGKLPLSHRCRQYSPRCCSLRPPSCWLKSRIISNIASMAWTFLEETHFVTKAFSVFCKIFCWATKVTTWRV